MKRVRGPRSGALRSSSYRHAMRTLRCKLPMRAWSVPRASLMSRPRRRHEQTPFT
ncbi:hypothetical protein BD310DRAFT_917436 [Dichomitus squalens]|uniref:Uncharacterized protein n=1 Tax=Dichomitus squalens TaxID=114155 RepID=A0A4Q9Q656_9APHY|nr:hypothetical protein BD310DRAFT_917436 [Dichomitus squalens]